MYTYTLAWGFFFEKSQAKPKSDIRTWPFSSSNILAGCKIKMEKKMKHHAFFNIFYCVFHDFVQQSFDILPVIQI